MKVDERAGGRKQLAGAGSEERGWKTNSRGLGVVGRDRYICNHSRIQAAGMEG